MWRYPAEIEPVGRFDRPIVALFWALAGFLAGCGDVRITYGDFHCPADPPAAVVVEFVARADGRPVAAGATGELRDGPYVERMSPTTLRHAAPGTTFALAGGYGREGIYDVRVETAFGEVVTWNRIRVAGDRCGPFTVVLQAPLIAH